MAQLKDLIVTGATRLLGNLFVPSATKASGDKIVITDATNGNVQTSDIALGTSTTTYLRNDGAWGTPPNTTYNAATTSAAGLMSAADKTKLDGIATSANAYSHPTSSGNKHIPSGGSSGQILRWSADGTATWGSDNNTTYSNFVGSGTGAAAGLVPAPSTTAGTTKYLREDGTWQVPPDNNTTYSNATTKKAGLMSAADKTKLNNISTGGSPVYSFTVNEVNAFISLKGSLYEGENSNILIHNNEGLYASYLQPGPCIVSGSLYSGHWFNGKWYCFKYATAYSESSGYTMGYGFNTNYFTPLLLIPLSMTSCSNVANIDTYYPCPVGRGTAITSSGAKLSVDIYLRSSVLSVSKTDQECVLCAKPMSGNMSISPSSTYTGAWLNLTAIW